MMNIWKSSPKQMSELLGVTVKTLQNWDKKGILKSYRTPTNRRYYTHSQYLDYIGASSSEEITGKTVIYTRVSNRGQMDDLANFK
ncbi:MerR family regulatory protein [Thermoflavimicrobium dichotomicum]|uniref:MerR family regulatory protein n=1 Tax=Thermoflavimicrobium dichotomicum TaxID=46223 RepID=A0A1I3U0E9_9BACL|nr:MerR family regulatory protein [Thermoflavimicrobium dichotomicum]